MLVSQQLEQVTGTELYRETGKLCKSHTSDISHRRDEAAGYFHTNSRQSVVEATLRDGHSLVACRAGQRGLLEKVSWYKGADPGSEKGQEHMKQESLCPGPFQVKLQHQCPIS